ncbi:MAG: carbohydrate kinase [Proteobacteria bacterium]|nr:carbohydrate kinase [Pseudomonadota bacterium]MBU1709642.1 carbohydrate kinase [Pseudomonadota bacterium]
MIIAVGEVVWDMFPDGRKVLGGAPVNVAYHLHTLGVEIGIISRIGSDILGEATVEKFKALGLPLDGLQRGDLPTGEVQVTVDGNNEPHFEIIAPAAWDNLDEGLAMDFAGDSKFDLVFGTLAQRDSRSRNVIGKLRAKASRRFYDVNLRPPFTTPELVLDSLGQNDIAKVNGHELLKIAGWSGCGGESKKDSARNLLERFDIKVLVVTEGSRGAWLVTGDQYFEDSGVKVEISDTVGAGDSFFAALIEGYVKGVPWAESLARANKRGAYVASQNGATPQMPEYL